MTQNPRFILFALALAALCASPPIRAQPAARPPQVEAAWTELTGAGAEVRAAVAGSSCPQAIIDGLSYSLEQRAAAGPHFPMVCSLGLPPHASAVSVEGRVLPLPRPVRRIVILGDTGCRVLKLAVQDCNDARAWPFAAVARLAAAQKPDLVIHVGDYYYRETPCPLGLPACAGSPSGDRWDTWTAEFFDPASPLLAAAPWVFARGNHELCIRGGEGWYTLLDAGPAPKGCPAVSAPFVVRTGGLNLFVIDSSGADDRTRLPDQVAAMAGQLDRLGADLESGQGWIITHRPIWGLAPVLRLGPAAPLQVGLNFTEQEAVRGRTLAGVQMVVSGHVHHFQAISFGPPRPAQLIVGTGGDVGEAADLPRIYRGQRDMDGLDAQTFSFSRFGYYLMERDGEDWTGAFHDQDDRVRAACRLHGRVLDCRPA
jgi:hypothetical protein